jgi:hypothetical protein
MTLGRYTHLFEKASQHTTEIMISSIKKTRSRDPEDKDIVKAK